MNALSDALSGLRAAQLQVDVAANNVANTNTPGFQPSEVSQAEQPGGGVAAKVVLGQAPPILPGLPPDEQPSGTDPTNELASLVTAPIAYAANGRVVDTAVKTTRSLLDIFA